MFTKRIIPCLDIKDGRTVKGVNFVQLADAGDPVELAVQYVLQGADELVFLDITATNEKRKTLSDLVRRIAQKINIPFTVGGGISSVEDVDFLLNAGADKIAVNSSAIKNPELITELAAKFGSQCVVVAIDAKKMNQIWKVFLNGGRAETALNLFDWAKTAEQKGAGEILFTSMDHDGTKKGFAMEPLLQLQSALSIPLIASGGAGAKEDFLEVFKKNACDAALAASVFHFGELKIPELKSYLQTQSIPVRIV